MKWIEARVVFDFSDTVLAMELIGNIFYELGVKGVVIEQTDAEPVEGWAEEGWVRPKQNAIIGYFPKGSATQRRCRILESRLLQLDKQTGIRSNVIYGETSEENWAESWKIFFKPVKISNTLVVKPTWQAYAPQTDETVLEIDPGMAFGTGTHPTTSLCLQMIETYLTPGTAFLDVGTGSGILMIAAAKLGASSLLGIDSDPIAVKVARKNLRLNGVSSEKFAVRTGHMVNGVKNNFRMLAANILFDVILDLLDHLDTVLVREGIFIVSGFIEENKHAILEKIESKGFRALETRVRENWIAVAGMRV